MNFGAVLLLCESCNAPKRVVIIEGENHIECDYCGNSVFYLKGFETLVEIWPDDRWPAMNAQWVNRHLHPDALCTYRS